MYLPNMYLPLSFRTIANMFAYAQLLDSRHDDVKIEHIFKAYLNSYGTKVQFVLQQVSPSTSFSVHYFSILIKYIIVLKVYLQSIFERRSNWNVSYWMNASCRLVRKANIFLVWWILSIIAEDKDLMEYLHIIYITISTQLAYFWF